ncbi:hypothetical protein DH2020_003548 [Rehmannia glutinosa]|uniref:Xyloglucan endotransglucosylase/hydrolase n=1 Tax=Rehmannia glutinosa TaxID=99300 RepID=A0ABR0XLY3_REHGL
MAVFHHNFILTSLFIFLRNIIVVYSRGPVYTPPDVDRLTDRFSRLSVNQSYNVFFGGANVHVTNNGTRADLSLDKSSDIFPHKHDEIDIELLGHEKRREWVLQTNIYGNGSVSTGREEKFYLWFDPTQGFHDYTILWNNHHILFLVDNIPVREVVHNNATSSVYPSKPMSVYATIWDASQWATHGGKYPVNYKFAPFVASMTGIEMEGCIVNSKNMAPSCSKSSVSSLDPVDGEQFSKLSSQQISGLEWARRKHMFYSYCQDKPRYKVLPQECSAK